MGLQYATTLKKQIVTSSGGYDGVQYLCVVEVYDSESNCWRKLAPLSTGRAGAAVVAVPPPKNVFWYNAIRRPVDTAKFIPILSMSDPEDDDDDDSSVAYY